MQEKRKAYRYFCKYRTQENYNVYAKARNKVKTECRKATKFREEKIAKEAKSNPKRFYQYVSSKTKPKDNVSPLLKDDGSMAQDDGDKAEVLNNYFASVFTNESDNNVPEFKCSQPTGSLCDINITLDQMKKALNGLNVSKSPGPDKIHPRILKELSNELALPFTCLFNKSLEEGVIPEAWKKAEVRPIFKKGDKKLPGNYRPVSLTSIVCKLFEGFVRDALTDHLTDNDLLSDSQFGFTSGRSCVTQLLNTVNDWLTDIDEGKPVDAIYLDYRKAFDTVPHRRLISKLKGYGIGGSVLHWIGDFLSGRSQYVKINDKSSTNINVTSGVPQGSVIGPTLFIYYINDMPEMVDCAIRIFADDTKAYSSVETEDKRKKLQENLDQLVKWTDQWLLHFNSTKCKVIHMGKKNQNYEYFIREGVTNNLLESVHSEKDLGVVVDEDLTFDDHITEVIKRANRISSLLIRTITFKNKNIMVPLFKALVRPILEYGNVVWCPRLKKHITNIENVQRRFTKCIIGQRNLSYEERLRSLNLPSLEYRRLRGDMIETYKILHNVYDSKTTKNLLTKADSKITRGHDLKLIKKSVGTTSFQHFFTNRITNTWNSLPQDTATAGSVNAFKNRLDKFLVSKTYCTDLQA